MKLGVITFLFLFMSATFIINASGVEVCCYGDENCQSGCQMVPSTQCCVDEWRSFNDLSGDKVCHTCKGIASSPVLPLHSFFFPPALL